MMQPIWKGWSAMKIFHRSIKWERVTSLALAASLCASYLLIPRGVTAEGESYICGMVEHTHTGGCYQLVCGKEERFSHTHVKPDCYDEEGHLTCELKEQTLHHHTQSCYSVPQPECGLEESEEHTHTAECYPTDFQPQLICGQEDVQEHRHTGDCYRLVCQLAEHSHTELCIAVEPTEEPQETQAAEPTEEPEGTEPDTLAAMKNIADVLTVGTLTVTYPKEETVYHLFRVGSMVNGTLVLDEEFSGVSTTDWKRTASVLSEVIQKTGRGTELSQAVVTGGSAVFGGLGEAVYLVMGDETVTNGITDTPVPFLTAMPGTDGQNQPVWDVQAAGEQQETMDISVTKVWVGDRVSGRPASIIVHLTLDGKDYGPLVRLNYANHWSYTWENLPVGNWSVREESSRRYTTTMTREGNTFTFTSTWKKIPQTGQLWWPVAAMSAAGVCLVGAGLLRRRKQDKNA